MFIYRTRKWSSVAGWGLFHIHIRVLLYHGKTKLHSLVNRCAYGVPTRISQGCGNTEMCYLSPGKLSEKSYLSCFFVFKHLILANTVAKLNLFILSITSLRKIWNIVLIKLTQTSLSKSVSDHRRNESHFKFGFQIGMCSQRIAGCF